MDNQLEKHGSTPPSASAPEKGLQRSSVKGYLSAIRHLQILGGMGDPLVASWPLLECTLNSLKLKQAKCPSMRSKIRLLITPVMLQLREVWEKENNHPDPEAHLSDGDVSLDSQSNPTVVRVRIKASKTDPFRKGVFVFLGITGNDLCPVAAMAAYLVIHGRNPGPFFRFQSGVPLSRELLVRHVRAALREKGIDDSKYAGHSFRIGAATSAAAVGVEDSLVKTLGR